MRPSGRGPEAMRPVSLEPGVAKYAEGSCLARFGDTHVLCMATVEERVPPFLRNTGRGWVTAEYGMLPRSTHSRTDRTAAITGSYVALYQALAKLCAAGLLPKMPLNDSVAAISCGVCDGIAVLDLDYAEDSKAMTDANFVLTGSGGFVEIQATAEGAPFDETRFGEMLALARHGIGELTRQQRVALGLS